MSSPVFLASEVTSPHQSFSTSNLTLLAILKHALNAYAEIRLSDGPLQQASVYYWLMDLICVYMLLSTLK